MFRPLTLLISLGIAGGLALSPPANHASGSPSPARVTASSVVSYAPPVGGSVVRGFQPPVTLYGPGHLGVDLATSTGEDVFADGSGTVAFAGQVAGRGVVVINHPDGIRTEVEPVRPLVKVGDVVEVGALIATVNGAHAPCQPGTCLHWGARLGNVYFDPESLLQPLGPVRLLPWTTGSRGPAG